MPEVKKMSHADLGRAIKLSLLRKNCYTAGARSECKMHVKPVNGRGEGRVLLRNSKLVPRGAGKCTES